MPETRPAVPGIRLKAKFALVSVGHSGPEQVRPAANVDAQLPAGLKGNRNGWSAEPVHLNDDHPFAAGISQVNKHQPASLDRAQPRRLTGEVPPVEKNHRFADGQFSGQLLDRR
jgi:hypothetical protein